MKTYLFALAAAVALVAGACGDDDGGGGNTAAPTDPRGEEIIAVLQSDEDIPLSDEEANCTANNMLANLDDSTIDAMLDDEDTDFSDLENPEDAVTAVNAMLDCVDLQQMMVDSMVADGTPQDQAECMANGFGEDELRSFMEASVLPDDQVDEDAALAIFGTLMEIAAECGFEG